MMVDGGGGRAAVVGSGVVWRGMAALPLGSNEDKMKKRGDYYD